MGVALGSLGQIPAVLDDFACPQGTQQDYGEGGTQLSWFWPISVRVKISSRRSDGSVGMALVLPSADILPVVVRIPAGPLGSLKCVPPKGNGRRPQKKGQNKQRWRDVGVGAGRKMSGLLVGILGLVLAT